MENQRSAYLFQQYVKNECTSQEREEFMALLRDSDKTESLENLFDGYWEISAETELEKNRANEIFNQVISTNTAEEKQKPSRFIKIWMGWAAAILVIGFITLYALQKPKNEIQIADTEQRISDLIIKPSDAVTVTTFNEHKKITLPDGSTVILNKKSSLQYPKNFGDSKREVLLTGEGYFDIKHDVKRTFTVHTGKINTVVLGTAFNIKAYENEKDVTVTVTRGKVSVQNNKFLLGVLIQNQQIIFNKDYKKANQLAVKAKNSVQWQEGDIFFDDTSMEEAATILSKRFNIPINFTNEKAKKCRFSATFLKGEKLEEIIKLICSFNNATYQTSASGITINGEGCE